MLVIFYDIYGAVSFTVVACFQFLYNLKLLLSMFVIFHNKFLNNVSWAMIIVSMSL